MQSVGEPLLHAHTMAFVASAVSVIMASPPPCKLGALHSQAMLAKPIEEVAPLLLVGVDFKGALPEDSLQLAGDAGDRDAMLSQVYRVKLQHLTKFAETARLATIDMPMVQDSQQQDSRSIPIDQALPIMGATAAVTDLMTFVAILHCELMPKLANPTNSTQDYLLGFGCWLLKAFQVALDDTETLLKEAGALAVEVAGLQLPMPFATMRCWRESLSIFAGLIQKALLGAWMSLLNDKVSSTKVATPSWQIALQGGDGSATFNVELAMKAFGSKLNPLVKAHNDLHELLRVVLGFLGVGLQGKGRHRMLGDFANTIRGKMCAHGARQSIWSETLGVARGVDPPPRLVCGVFVFPLPRKWLGPVRRKRLPRFEPKAVEQIHTMPTHFLASAQCLA